METNLLNPQNQLPTPRSGFWRYLFLVAVIAIVLGAAVFASAKLFGQEPTGEPPITHKKPGFLTQIKNLMLSSDRELKGQTEDRVNVLLLGIGGEGHDGPYLTDTIILASIKPSTKQVTMLSIPRDLIMFIPGYGYRKINNANAFGETKEVNYGPIFASEVISQTLDMPIHYYIRADFTAFKEIIDRLGGVRVYVDKPFTDYNFPTDNYKVKTLSFEEGWQAMDGETALNFARSRHGTGGENNDFARSRRQQKILLAVKNKALSSLFFTAGKIDDIIGSLGKHVNTNLEWWEMIALYKLTKNLNYENMINRVLTDGPGGPLVQTRYNGAEVLEPRNDSFDEIKLIARNIFLEESSKPQSGSQVAPSPAGEPSGPKIEVQNGTWILGLAAKTKAALEDAGVKITEIGNARERNFEKTVIYDLSGGRFKKDLTRLKNQLDAEILSPSPATASSTADILIIVGSDKNK